jgi:Na+/proline symporter
MVKKHDYKSWLPFLLPLLFTLFGLFFAFVGFSEFYNVAIKNEGSAYAFGGGYQWYYESESIYWKYMLIEGSIYLITSIFTIVSIIRKKKRMAAAGAIAIFILFVIMMINANSAPYE